MFTVAPASVNIGDVECNNRFIFDNENFVSVKHGAHCEQRKRGVIHKGTPALSQDGHRSLAGSRTTLADQAISVALNGTMSKTLPSSFQSQTFRRLPSRLAGSARPKVDLMIRNSRFLGSLVARDRRVARIGNPLARRCATRLSPALRSADRP